MLIWYEERDKKLAEKLDELEEYDYYSDSSSDDDSFDYDKSVRKQKELYKKIKQRIKSKK